VVTADLSGPKGVDALASAAPKLGTVDVLVNNAGAYAPMSFDQGDNKGQGPLDGMLPQSSCRLSSSCAHVRSPTGLWLHMLCPLSALSFLSWVHALQYAV